MRSNLLVGLALGRIGSPCIMPPSLNHSGPSTWAARGRPGLDAVDE
jgi:hypothetical protein